MRFTIGYIVGAAIGLVLLTVGCDSLGSFSMSGETYEAAEQGIVAVASSVNPLLGVAAVLGAKVIKSVVSKDK